MPFAESRYRRTLHDADNGISLLKVVVRVDAAQVSEHRMRHIDASTLLGGASERGRTS